MQIAVRQSKYVVLLIFFLALCIAAGCQQKAEVLITDEEAENIKEGFLAFRVQGDHAAADRVYHQDCVIDYPNLPEPLRGLDAYKEYDTATRNMYPDFNMTIDEYFVIGDKIFSFWTVDATNTGPLMTPMGELPPTNRKIHFAGIAVSRVVDGKIIEDKAFFNTLAMMEQLGFTIVPPENK